MAAGATITTFRDRPWRLRFFLVLGGAMMVQGVATATYFLVTGDADFWFAVTIHGLSAALIGFGFWFASYAWRRLRDPEPPIMIGPAGLHDRAISEQPIPWSDLRNFVVWEGAAAR